MGLSCVQWISLLLEVHVGALADKVARENCLCLKGCTQEYANVFFPPITVNLWHFSRSNPGVRTWTEYPPLIEIKSTSFGMKRTFQKGNISCHTSSMFILSQVSSSAKVLSFPLKSSWVVLWNSAHMTRAHTYTQFPLKRHSHNYGFAGSDTVFYKMLCTQLVSQMLITVEIHQLASSNLQLLSINHTEH